MRKPMVGHIYVLELTGGRTKVGYSSDPKGRLSQYAVEARKNDLAIVRRWVSPRHVEAGLNEEALIASCEGLGGAHYGSGREHFSGLRFEDVVNAAEGLTFTAYRGHATAPLREARNRLGQIIDEARITGQPVVITDNGRPVARIVPIVPEIREKP